MKTVKVYTVKSYDADVYPTQTFLTHFPDQAMQEPLRYLRCSEGIIDTYVETEQLPIKEYRWANGVKIFAAMSRELREIIGIEVDELQTAKNELQYERDKNREVKSRLESYINAEIGFMSMNFWQRLKWAFKKER